MKKINHGKKIGIIASSLAMVALIGTGFSAWVIGNQNTKTDAGDITVSVGDVHDAELTFTAKIGSNNAVSFDAKAKEDCAEGAIAPGEDSVNREDLSFTIDYTIVAGANSGFDKSTYKVAAYLTDTSATQLDEAVKAGYVVLPTNLKETKSAADISIADASSSGSDKVTYTGTITFNFTWGATFYGKNPCDVTSSDVSSNKEKFITDLKAFSAMDLTKFGVTLELEGPQA